MSFTTLAPLSTAFCKMRIGFSQCVHEVILTVQTITVGRVMPEILFFGANQDFSRHTEWITDTFSAFVFTC